MSESQPERPARFRNRWWQYSLRSLLFLTLLAALVAKYYSGPEVLDEAGPQGAHRIVRQVIRDRAGNPVNHGTWSMYDSAGNRLVQGVYHKGEPYGWWRYWHNEEPPVPAQAADPQGAAQASPIHRRSMEGRYLRGQRDGRWTAWYPTGHKHWEIDYAHGKSVGAIRRWNPDGTPASETGPEAGFAAGTAGPTPRVAPIVSASAEQPRRPTVASVIETWRQALAGSDPQRRSEAGWALGRLNGAADALTEAMKIGEGRGETGSANVRAAALISAASRSDSLQWLSQFQQALADDNLAVRLAAIDALSQLGPAAAAALPRLEAPLPRGSARPTDSKRNGIVPERDRESDLERCFRLAALSSIDAGRENALEEFLRSCLSGGRHWVEAGRGSLPSVIEVAPLRETPANFEPPPLPSYPRITRYHVAGLLRLLQHREAELRALAALAIGRIEPPPAEAIAPLVALLDDADAGVQLEACRSLARFGPAAVEAVPALQRLATGLDAELALVASATLYAINPPKQSPFVLGVMHTGNSGFGSGPFSGSAFGGFGGGGR